MNELVQNSFLEEAPIVEVSARSGEGLDKLLEHLRQFGLQVPPREGGKVARLPIDRVFSMRGFGAVVTGTLIAGSISEGDELDRLPAGRRLRVRGVQVYGKGEKIAHAGQRTALNLGGVEISDLERGMVLATVGTLRTSQTIDALVEVLPRHRGHCGRVRACVFTQGPPKCWRACKYWKNQASCRPAQAGWYSSGLNLRLLPSTVIALLFVLTRLLKQSGEARCSTDPPSGIADAKRL
ncbi:MAG: EF-Tu/IF-2/RF-3 family GTPase [Pyrinomonadaceae bacterium]